MELDRNQFTKRLDKILGLVKTLEIALLEEPERLCMKDISELTDILENKLIEAIEYIKMTD